MKGMKVAFCLVLLGGFVLGTAVDASAYTSHNWRSWACTTGYVEGKCDMGCAPCMDMCGCGGNLCSIDCCGIVQGILSLPVSLLESVMSCCSCLCPCLGGMMGGGCGMDMGCMDMCGCKK